ncbi:MAG TPA: type II toxin-antitoxin system PemK/MazF family toxin [Thermoanaerobaculia bacterium]|nr:type II toxin-antitoxin system PemK/MazF family toxin [Thermoanaerobaculia bacterium]
MTSPADVRRGQVRLVALDPTTGRAIRKPRPCVVVSPDEFQGKSGHVVLDQIRTVTAIGVKRLGRLSSPALERSLQAPAEMFAP